MESLGKANEGNNVSVMSLNLNIFKKNQKATSKIFNTTPWPLLQTYHVLPFNSKHHQSHQTYSNMFLFPKHPPSQPPLIHPHAPLNTALFTLCPSRAPWWPPALWLAPSAEEMPMATNPTEQEPFFGGAENNKSYGFVCFERLFGLGCRCFDP